MPSCICTSSIKIRKVSGPVSNTDTALYSDRRIQSRTQEGGGIGQKAGGGPLLYKKSLKNIKILQNLRKGEGRGEKGKEGREKREGKGKRGEGRGGEERGGEARGGD